MNDVVKYLQECGTFYLATVEGDQPHVRPFGAVCEFEGKLYIVTNNKKDVNKLYQADGQHLTDYGNQKLLNLITPVIKKTLLA